MVDKGPENSPQGTVTQSTEAVTAPGGFSILTGDRRSLLGGRCSECGSVTFPFKAMCPSCGALKGMVPVAVGRAGVLKDRTQCFTAPAGMPVPYWVGVVELDEGPRVFTAVEGDETLLATVEAELRVELVTRTPLPTPGQEAGARADVEKALRWFYRVLAGGSC